MKLVTVDFDVSLPVSLDASENEIATTAMTTEAIKVEICDLMTSGMNDAEVVEATHKALRHHAGWTVDVSILRDDKSNQVFVKVLGHK